MPDIKGTVTGKLTNRGVIQWIPGFRVNRDDEGKWKGVHSFTCNSADAFSLLPAIGSPCTFPGASFLSLHTIDLEDNGNITTVNCQYGSYTGPDFDFDSDGENSYSLGITTSQEDIETNPNYNDVPDPEKILIQKYKNGVVDEEVGTPYKMVDSNDVSKAIGTIDSDLGKELFDKIKVGVTSYLTPGQIWSVTYYSKVKPNKSVLDKVGKICNAKGAPDVDDDRDWLCIGVNSSKSQGVYTITIEWQLSLKGGWDEDLYDNA